MTEYEQELRFRIFSRLIENEYSLAQSLAHLDDVHNKIRGMKTIVQDGELKQTVAKAFNK